MSQPGRPVYGEVPRYGHSQPIGNQPLLPPPPARVATPAIRQPVPSSARAPDQRRPEARWSRRVAAFLIDAGPALLASGFLVYGYAVVLIEIASSSVSGPSAQDRGLRWLVIGGGALLLALGWLTYDRWLRAGRTGQSVGKRALRLSLVGEQTGAPIGARYAFMRDLVHILDAVAYVGFLWPLWDDRRQTFADKIMRTVVLDQRHG